VGGERFQIIEDGRVLQGYVGVARWRGATLENVLELAGDSGTEEDWTIRRRNASGKVEGKVCGIEVGQE
jgi:hypothetical protein